MIENTRKHRQGKLQAHDTPTTHLVKARFELGENAAASLNKGDAVVVTGRKRSTS